MTTTAVGISLSEHLAEESEIASLALKFYLDSNCQEGHERENRLCAEYMLAQKQLIEYRISALHHRLRA